MSIARRVAPVGRTSVGWHSTPSDRLSFSQAAHLIASIAMLMAAVFGIPLDTPLVAIAICVAILLFGLPHGTFDLALIRQAHANRRIGAVVLLYLGCAAAMYAVWRFAPGVALVIFFGLSVVHFAEDWADRLPPFFAHGTSTALLTASAFLHRDTIAALFVLLAGDESSAILTAVAILVAPVSLAIASVAIIALWYDGHRNAAIATGVALLAMVILPPIVGFALFFCLFHSPKHFAAARHMLGWHRTAQWAHVTVPLTAAALAIAGLIFATHVTSTTVTSAMIVTAFTTLSILTLPHMAVPVLLKQMSRATAKSPYWGDSSASS
jgi:beta-carotene 15,15'-dioxygenase